MRALFITFSILLFGNTFPLTAQIAGTLARDTVSARKPPKEELSLVPMFKGAPLSAGKFHRWLIDAIEYPDRAMKYSYQGTVLLRFVIEKDGSLGEIEILESPNPELSIAVLKAIVRCPKWSPAEKDGKVVRCYMRVPVVFKLAIENRTRSNWERSRNSR